MPINRPVESSIKPSEAEAFETRIPADTSLVEDYIFAYKATGRVNVIDAISRGTNLCGEWDEKCAGMFVTALSGEDYVCK